MEPSVETLERICDAQWNHGEGEGVSFSEIYTHDACNHTLSGTIDVDGVTYGFIIENGNWDGTVVKAWGDPEDVGTFQPPPPPEPLRLVPVNRELRSENPALFKVYLLWRKEEWFKRLEGGYAYDRRFQPGEATVSYYREKAAARGLAYDFLSNLDEKTRKAIERTLG